MEKAKTATVNEVEVVKGKLQSTYDEIQAYTSNALVCKNYTLEIIDCLRDVIQGLNVVDLMLILLVAVILCSKFVFVYFDYKFIV